MEVKRVYLKTEHGYTFNVKLYNGDTYTHFECKTWQALCKAYAFDPDMVITFDIHGRMILKVIETFGSMCRRLQFYHYVSSSQLYFCLWYCLFKNNWQLISIDSLFPFKQTCPVLGGHDLLLSRSWINCEEISHYVSWLEDLHTVKTDFLPALRNVSTQNVQPIVIVLNYGHIYLRKMVRFLLFVLSASFAYIFLLLNFHW